MRTDAELMVEFQQGQREAFEKLVLRHQVGLFNFFMRVFQAEFLVQWIKPLLDEIEKGRLCFLRRNIHAQGIHAENLFHHGNVLLGSPMQFFDILHGIHEVMEVNPLAFEFFHCRVTRVR